MKKQGLTSARQVANEAKRLKGLKKENRRLKKIVADRRSMRQRVLDAMRAFNF